MSVGVEALFTSALGLKSPWEVVKVELDTGKRRIDFEVACNAKQLPCPACGVSGQGIHDRVRRDWRHLDFFQNEAWLHADVPRVDCGARGNMVQFDREVKVDDTWESSFIGGIAIPAAAAHYEGLYRKLVVALIDDADFRSAVSKK